MMRATALVILGVTVVRAQNDIINGSEEGDDLRGGIGSDTMLGNLGNDTMLGQNGEDILKGGPGDDRLSGGNGEDIIRGDAGDDVVASGTGDDVLQGGTGADFLVGGPGDDLLLGGPANDTLLGGAGNDTMSGEGGQDVFFGGPGNDTLQGQPGLDTCVLSPSDDDCVTLNFGTTCDVNTCLPSAVPILRGDSIDAVGPSLLLPSVEASTCTSLTEGSLVRTFVAPNVAGDGDTLGVTISNIAGEFAGAGVTFSTSSCCPSTCEDDVILFADDNDDGDDTDDDDDDDAQDVTFNIPVDDVNGGNVYIFVSFPRANKDLTFTITTGDEIVAPVVPPATLRRSLKKQIEDSKNIQSKKSKSRNELHKAGKFVRHNKKQSAFIVEQCAAVNASCDPNLATRFAKSLQLQKVNMKRAKTQTKKTPYVARVSPALSPEVIASVKIASGADFEEVEKNNPVAVGPNGSIFIGGAGDDILRGKGGNDRMAGQDGDDTMIGAQDNDLLIGGEDNDLLIAGPGNDIVQGNAGNDTAIGGSGNDTMIGGPGDDILRGGADTDILAGAVGNDTLRGNAGSDLLEGGDGEDHFFGGADKDVMFGDAGNDVCLLQPADAFLIDFDSTCDNALCGPFTETLANDGTEQNGEVFTSTQPSVRFECDNMADDITVEGAQVFAIDTSAFTPPVQVQIEVTSAQFEGTIALSDSCCAQTCAGTETLVNGAATLTQVFIETPPPATIYAFVTSFNQTRGTFMIAASEAAGVEIGLP